MAKQSEKNLLKELEEFKKYRETVQLSTTVDTSESIFQQKRRIKRLLEDYASFISHYFPHICESETAYFQKKLATDVRSDPNCFLVRLWPRGHAKSSHMSLMILIWLMVNEEIWFIVLVSATQSLAETLLVTIQIELESNERLKHDFGEFYNYGSWSSTDFTTQQGVKFRGLGRRQRPRGLKKGAKRPDIIVVDDLDDDELVLNPKLVRKAYQWTMSALYGCFPMSGGRFIAVGNLFSKTSVIKMLCDNPISDVEKIVAMDSEGNLAWPEHYTKEMLQLKIDAMGYISAQQEYFHNPITEGTIYKREWFQFKRMLALTEYEALICYTDPSFKSGGKNDYKATVLIGKTGNEYHLIKAFVAQTSVVEMVEWHYIIQDWAGESVAINYYMEASFMQDLLLETFDEIALEKGRQVFVSPDKRKKPNKLARIEAMSALFERGFFYINVDEQDSKHVQTLIEQFLTIEKGSRAPDDAPDAVEGAIFLLNQNTKVNQQPVVIPMSNRKSKYRY